MKKKYITWLITFIILATLVPLDSHGKVYFTKESKNADTVYVAGNPNLYPIEYYDEKSNTYMGIMPNILEIVSEKTGIDFTYINASDKDQRANMAENLQVSIVSGVTDVKTILTKGPILFVYEHEGKTYEVCFAYTNIASMELKNAINKELSEIDSGKMLKLSIEASLQNKKSNSKTMIIALIVVSLVFLCYLIISLISMSRKKRKLKYYDIVTGLGNRKLFNEYFNSNINAHNIYSFAFVYIDFDINCYMTYSDDDMISIYKYIKNIIKDNANSNDFFVRFDYGGFMIARHYVNQSELKIWMNNILSSLENLDHTNNGFSVKMNAGIYLPKVYSASPDIYAVYAYQSYLCSKEHKTFYSICDSNMIKDIIFKMELTRDIKDAFKKNEFEPYLQLVLDMEGTRIAAEVLARWNKPSRGQIKPSVFIPILKQNDLLYELDFLMFDKACSMIEENKSEDGFFLICNFSKEVLIHATFEQTINKILANYNFPHKKIVVEILQDTNVSNVDLIKKSINILKEMGFGISVDNIKDLNAFYDFGVDLFKISTDMAQIAIAHNDFSFLKSIIKLCHDLNCKVICEGLEKKEHVVHMFYLGCDYIKGYYVSPPIPYKEFLNIM